jgi:hypothetical protein
MYTHKQVHKPKKTGKVWRGGVCLDLCMTSFSFINTMIRSSPTCLRKKKKKSGPTRSMSCFSIEWLLARRWVGVEQELTLRNNSSEDKTGCGVA